MAVRSLTLSACFQPAPEKARVDIKKFVKIGRPGYRVNKQRAPESGQQSLLFQVDYPGECSVGWGLGRFPGSVRVLFTGFGT